MTSPLGHYIDVVNDMLESYVDLRTDQQKLDRIARLKWELPEGMPAWARPFRTTVPYDAIRAGVRVLTGLEEQLTIDPYAFQETELGDVGIAKKKANSWEAALKWQMDRAVRRRAILRQDVVRSALMYDEVVGQIVHLPTQIKAIKKMGGNPNRQQAALRFGDFVVQLRNPQSVYTKYSDYMLEAVLYATIKPATDIYAFWNNPELGKLLESDNCPDEWAVFDYVDYDRRVVFCYPGSTIQRVSESGTYEDKKGDELPAQAIELMNEEWKYDFLPWAAVVGGTQLVTEPEDSRFPLLFGLMKADQWNNTNIMGTLVLSEAIAEAARPDVKRSGIQPDSVEAAYGQAGGTWDVPPGHDVQDMPQKGLDPALREAFDRQISDMGRSTIPQVLVTAEMGADEPFAGFNLRIQQAMASLMPYKFLAERWFEEAYRLMLYWSKESGMPLSAPSGERVEPSEIDKDRIYLGVELQQDVPIDKQQRMATAIQAARELKLPTRDVLEMLGEADPERKIREWMMEQFDQAYLAGSVQFIQFQAAHTIEQQMMQAQLQQQAAMQQAQMQPPQAGGGQQGAPFAPQGVAGVEGQIANPNTEGGGLGLPPAMMAPELATRESATGMDAGGGPIMG